MTETPQTPAPVKKAAAKKAPAKKAADAPKAERKPGRNLYLAALPEGWNYDHVEAVGPNGERISMVRAEDGDGVALSFVSGAGERRGTAPSMTDASKAAAKGAKTLAEVAKREAALQALRDEGFASLGDEVKPEPQTGTDLGGSGIDPALA